MNFQLKFGVLIFEDKRILLTKRIKQDCYGICFLFIDLFCLNYVSEMSEGDSVTSEANLHYLPTLEDPVTEQTTSEDDKLHSATKSVIFPNHLHVPEAFKNSLMFGSLEPSLEQNNDSSSRDASIVTDVEVSKEPFVR